MTDTIIGIDHGYSDIKTAHTVFRTGCTRYMRRPPVTGGRCMIYNGHFYDLGGKRLNVSQDRLSDDRLFILTLGAAAGELAERGLFGPQTVTIAAGLPIADFAQNASAFEAYLLRGGPGAAYHVELGGRTFDITIEGARIYPQGYAAAAAGAPELFSQPVLHIIDIGGWTLDTLTVTSGVPDPDSIHSFERGMRTCTSWIVGRLEQDLGFPVMAEQAEAALADGYDLSSDPEVLRHVDMLKQEWLTGTLGFLREKGFRPGTVPTVFAGGGGAFLRSMQVSGLVPEMPLTRFLPDVRANAVGYEQLAAAETGRPAA